MSTVPTPDDVFQGVRAVLVADSGYATQLPGGAWFGRRPDQKTYPYLVGTVSESPPHYEQSDGKYLQTFMVELTIWCESGDAAVADTNTARAWLDSLLGWSSTDPANGVSVSNAVATISVKPVGGRLELSDELRRGHDILAAGKRLEITINGRRT